MPYTLKDGSSCEDRRLDRIAAFDRRSLDFPVTASLNADQQQLVSKTWSAPAGTPVLDQGKEGACVGFGVTNELLFYPVAVKGLDAAFAREKIYWVAQEDDPWPGGSYPQASPVYEGTSVLYGVKAAADLGYYKTYSWATVEKEMALGVGHLGPAIIGIDWYEGMFQPNSDGFIRPSGDKAGGHCILVKAVNVKAGYYVVHNSWGPSWGNKGDAKIKRTDMAKLIADNGECCIITERSVPAPTKATVAAKADAILPGDQK